MSTGKNKTKDARAYAQDMASFAFNTAMQILKIEPDADARSKWLDGMVDEFEVQIIAMHAPEVATIFVDHSVKKSGDGTISKPFKSVAEACAAAEQSTTCQWTIDDELLGRVDCTKVATHTTCDPVGGAVCEAHKCRCSKPLKATLCDDCAHSMDAHSSEGCNEPGCLCGTGDE